MTALAGERADADHNPRDGVGRGPRDRAVTARSRLRVSPARGHDDGRRREGHPLDVHAGRAGV